MFRASIRLLAVGCCLMSLGAGCREEVRSVLPTVIQETASPSAEQGSSLGRVEWISRGNGVARASVLFSTSTASTIILYRFSLADYQASFEQSTSTAAVSEWQKRLPEARFISNGVYFHEDLLPSGWFKTKKRVVGTRAFDADKSALLVLQPNIDIVTEPAELKKAQTHAIEAAQSFPVLILNGHANVRTESGKASRRTFVGIDQAHMFLYVGIVPYTGISLYELGQTLERLPIRWEAVLNMDGGPSSGIGFRDEAQPELVDSYITVPNVLVLTPHR